jgi:hypothetical protein
MSYLLQDLSITEISLVDKPSNRNAVVALAKRDDASKPVGGTGDFALPVYQPNQDPEYPVFSDKRRKRMKVRDVCEMVKKNDLSESSAVVVWDALLTKSDKEGGTRQEREARVGKMLENDYRSGGALINYLQQGDARMSRDSYDAARKSESNRDSLGSPALDAAVVKIMKAEPNLNRHEAVRKLLTSPQGDVLYSEYERRRARVLKLDPNQDYPNDSADANDADDDGDKNNRGRSKSGRAKRKSSGDGIRSAIDGDDENDGADGNDGEDEDDLEIRKAFASARRWNWLPPSSSIMPMG